MTTKTRRHEEKLGPKDVAELDAEQYEEPGRSLQDTRPVEPRGAGAAGDEENPRSKVDRGADRAPADEEPWGANERAKLAKTRRT